MNKVLIVPGLLVAMIVFLTAISANAETPLDGYWLTENERSVIKVKECDMGLCGHVYWIIDGGMQTDLNNPEETLRGRPMCGLPILWGMEKQSATEWEDGKIYKADDGDIYDADLELLDDGTLKVRGYLGLSWLGKTQIWKRVSPADYPACG
ncbi:MAG: hypothetical protein CMH27_10375 [Micavibrio sp.]|nr:hypothetical protein [Micavibrio sp.]|tara:strand:- start:2721 stop:3176 length:456 start_codon:yes stop_codon:yes gene_type:complete